jgi:transposase-like protein
MKLHETDIFQKRIKQPLEDADQELDQVPEVESGDKSKVACICPGCGKMHVMKIRWIGRGVPRKFCQHCKDRQTPLDDED